MNSSSLAPAMAARASATFLSNTSRSCFREVMKVGLIARAADRAEIERVLDDCGFAPAREFGHVPGEAADGHGLLMRFPIRVAFGTRSRSFRVVAIS